MDNVVLGVFAVVYVGLILGGIPGFALDRTGIALLGALVLIGAGVVTPATAWDSIHVPTIGLLFGIMIVSAQLSTSGFYARITDHIGGLAVAPSTLLALVIATSGLLSAVLVNDIVCLAMAPVLVDVCAKKELDPVPFLLALAASANVGSAATLIGNPQNMLVGQTLHLSFSGYLADAFVPSLLGLVVVHVVVVWSTRGRWFSSTAGRPAVAVSAVEHDAQTRSLLAANPRDVAMTRKALICVAFLVGAFLFAPWPREVAALGVAGFLLLNRRTPSRDIVARVDVPLLLLFMGLFVVNHALQATGRPAAWVAALTAHGFDAHAPANLFLLSIPLANIVSNVPAVMLLLPNATHPQAGAVLALASTLSGNLMLVGSLANLIVVDQASRRGVKIGWRHHARVGVPITLLTLAIAAVWLVFRSG